MRKIGHLEYDNDTSVCRDLCNHYRYSCSINVGFFIKALGNMSFASIASISYFFLSYGLNSGIQYIASHIVQGNILVLIFDFIDAFLLAYGFFSLAMKITGLLGATTYETFGIAPAGIIGSIFIILFLGFTAGYGALNLLAGVYISIVLVLIKTITVFVVAWSLY